MEFNKQNTLYLLIVLNIQREKGIFLDEMIRELEIYVQNHNKNNSTNYSKIARSTIYGYLKDINRLVGNIYQLSDVGKISKKFLKDHPKLSDKFFRKFNKLTFSRAVQFLVEGDYLVLCDSNESRKDLNFNLYVALGHFLETTSSDHDYEHNQLVGGYKVFRPSLSNSEKILVSCAIIETLNDGSLQYQELMHFNDSLGWRRQILEGNIINKNKSILCITKDTNTAFAQVSFLKPIVTQPKNGKPIVTQILGRYNGTSTNTESGFFSTGIFMHRVDLRNVGKHPVQKWKTGWLSGYGLIKKKDIDKDILKFLE